MKAIELPKALQAKFELVKWPGNSHYQFFGKKFRTVDLAKLTEKEAERLIGLKFPYLKKKGKDKPSNSQ